MRRNCLQPTGHASRSRLRPFPTEQGDAGDSIGGEVDVKAGPPDRQFRQARDMGIPLL